MLDHSLFQS